MFAIVAGVLLTHLPAVSSAPPEEKPGRRRSVAPVFSAGQRFSETPQTVTLSLPPGASGGIYFTVSGLASYPDRGSIAGTLPRSEIPRFQNGVTMSRPPVPTFPNDMKPEANAPQEIPPHAYRGPIELTATSVVRARVFEKGKAPGPVVTRTYFIGERLSALPVVSIAAEGKDLWDPSPLWKPGDPRFDPDDFLGEDGEAGWNPQGADTDRPSLPGGIYVLGNQAFSEPREGNLLTRYPHFQGNPKANFANHTKYIPVHVEFVSADRTLRSAADLEARISGNFSSGLPKRSLMLKSRNPEARKAIAAGFRAVPAHKYRTVFLRTGGDASRVRNETLVRLNDQARRALGSRLDMQAYEPAVVFINGQYWGLHNITEEKGDEFVDHHHGYNDDEIQMVDKAAIAHIPRKAGQATDHLPDFKELRDRLARAGADAASANAAGPDGFPVWFARNMDILDFVDHFIFETYFSKSDPSNNRAWKPLVGGKWRFIGHDYDDIDVRGGSAARNFLTTSRRATSKYEDGRLNAIWLGGALNNIAVRNLFINRACDYMNTVFAPSNIHAVLGGGKETDFADTGNRPPAPGSVVADIFAEMPREVPRWYYLFGDTDSSRYDWGRSVRDFHAFADLRPRYFRQFMIDEWRLPGSGAIGAASGSAAVDVSVDVSPPGSGLALVSTVRPPSFPWSGKYVASAPDDPLRTVPVPVKAVPRPGNRFTHWTEGGREVSREVSLELVLTGPRSLVAHFEPGSDPLTTDLRVTEIMYAPAARGEPAAFNEFLELKNQGARTLDLGGLTFTSGIEYSFPAGARLSPGEFAVLVPSVELFQKRYGAAAAAPAFLDTYLGRLSDSGETITLQNEAGVQVLSVSYEATAGKGLSLVTPASGGAGWRPSARSGGSPAADDR